MAGPVQSMLVALADAVAGVLNAELAEDPDGFAIIGWTALRKFLPLTNQNLTDLSQINLQNPPLVFMRPIDDAAKRIGGGLNPQFDGQYRVQLCIYARVGAGEAGESLCRDLMDLRQQMLDLLKPALLTVVGVRTSRCTLTDIEEMPAFGEASLVHEEVFASGTMLRFAIPGK